MHAGKGSFWLVNNIIIIPVISSIKSLEVHVKIAFGKRTLHGAIIRDTIYKNIISRCMYYNNLCT